MHKSAITVAVAAMLAGAPLAYAQTTQPAPTPMPQHGATSASFTTQSGDLRAGQMIGSSVYDVQNQNIGSVKDIVLDANGRVTAVVLDVGSFLGVGGKYVAVALNDLKMDNDRLTLNRTKDQLQNAPEYQLQNNSGNTGSNR